MPAVGRQPREKKLILWFRPSGILVLAALLDYWLGDPRGWLHPVQVMGWLIQTCSRWVWQLKAPLGQRIAGVFLGLGLVGGSAGLGWLLVWLGWRLNIWIGVGIEVVLLASCFAGRSLRAAAAEVQQPLAGGNLAAARTKLSLYVGRDTDRLSEPEIRRAILETVAENSVDGVMAPLFYALLGAATPIGSVPLALAYKATSTLDSMIGYRRPPYTHLGWFSARLDDCLTWFPCRLQVLTLALLCGRPGQVWQLCRRDANQDPSPNSGWSECAYAAALGVQLGGTNWYQGIAKPKPKLGDPTGPITTKQIQQALRLTESSFWLWLLLAVGMAAIVSQR